MDSGILSLYVKQLECESISSAPFNAEAKNVWNYTSTPPYIFIMWPLSEHKENFACILHLVFPHLTLFAVNIFDELLSSSRGLLCCDAM